LFSVVKGEPTDVELAALTAVVLSLGSTAPEGDAKPSVRHWVRRQQLRLAPTPGPGAWKRSRGYGRQLPSGRSITAPAGN
jgi:hypothetical protein